MLINSLLDAWKLGVLGMPSVWKDKIRACVAVGKLVENSFDFCHAAIFKCCLEYSLQRYTCLLGQILMLYCCYGNLGEFFVVIFKQLCPE